jgi:subtilisin family serine protease
MKKGDKELRVWGLIVILMIVVSAFCWAAGSEEAGAYKVGDYSEQGESLFNTTEPNEVANKSICSVTLITGDIVIVSTLPTGRRGFAIKHADSTKSEQNYQIIETPKGTYIFPEGIDLSKVDKELFNIDYLVKEEYCNLTYLPILVDYKDKEEKVFGVAEQKELEKVVNITIVKSYHSIPTFSAKLSFEGINRTFKTLVERPEIKKIWLDKKVKVSLYESVPLIGAPELWKSGYNGSGLEIAILDTGIDDTHPDLDDLDDNPATYDPKVIVKKDFTDDETTEDLYGHGTHCAGIAAGTGAAPSEPYPTPTPVTTPTVTPTPPSSSEFSMHLRTGENFQEQKVKRAVYSSDATSPDAYEPDDNYWLANGIPTNGTKQLHHFHVPGDLDYVKFNTTESTRYLIETSDLGYESDTYMYLYDMDGLTEITHDDDSGEGLASRIIWKCDASGTYYVKVKHFSSSASGPNTHYNISVSTYVPPAEFNDIYSDYGEDTDGDGLYDYLVIDVGVNVTKAGRYEVSGDLYENGTYNYVDYDSNTTDLNEGNQTIQLRFEGIRLRQNEYNGTYDLKYLELENATYPYPVPPGGGGGAPPSPDSERELEEQKIESGEISLENVPAMYGEQLDYRYYACTTLYYNWTEFQRPPAEFTGNFNDYGEDSDGDGLYDYLVIEAEINVTKGGDFEFWDDLYYYNETMGYWEYGVDCHKHNYSYLDAGVHNLTIKLDGIEIRKLEYNGTFKVRLYLDGKLNSKWVKIDEAEYYTKTYNWTEFQKPPAEFTGNFNDYGEDSDGDGLYDYLVIEAEINVTKGGDFEFWDDLYYYNEATGSWEYGVDCHRHNYSYLDAGVHNLTIKLDGIEIRELKYNGTFKMRLYLDGRLNSRWIKIDEAEYYTKTYNWTEFQKPPAEFNDVYSDYGDDTNGDGLYDFLVIEVGVNVTKAGRYRVSGELYENGTYHWVDYTTKSAYLSEGNQIIKLKFSGIEIRENSYNGTYDLKHLGLYSKWKEDGYTYWKKFDYRYYAYTTDYYNYTDFQEFPGYIGVAPGAYLWNVKVLNQYGRGYESGIIDGIEYAAYGPDETANTGDEADIISMSLGGAPTDGTDPLSQAVNEAVDQGLVVAVAAGNDYDYFTVSTPGAAEKVITVGASDKEDDLAYFSSKGPTLDLRVKPDIVAPGVDIIAPRASGTSMGYPYNDYYTEASGTSMATPHVAGAAALILQVHPDWTPEEVKNVLISTADDLGYNVYQQGGGRIYVPSAANPKILVDPATISFKNLDTTSETITFKNLDTVMHTLTLDVSVREVFNDTEVDCAHLNRTSLSIAPGSSASVLLTVNNTSLAHSLYSGKVSATYSGGEVHSIFGFSNLNKVTVDKKNMSGMPAVDEFVVIFSDVEDAWEKLMIHDGITDENGTVTFYLPDGTYNIISVSGWQIAIICAVEEVVYKGNVSKPEETLNSLREFRDRALKDKYVALYYEYSPDIRRVLIEEPCLLLEAAKLITKYRPAVKYVLGEESGKDLQMDKKEVEEITSFTNKLKDAIKERETQIGAERSSEIIKSIEELKEQIKFSEGEMFSRALEDSIYSQNNIVVNKKAGKEAEAKEEPIDASVYTIKENITIESGVNITLDERDAYVIDFDYNKTEQTMSEKFDEVYYQGNVSVMFASHRSYPNETRTYITPTNSFKSIFIYSYYPEEYYNESNFSLINAPEWHKFLYNLSSVTENVTFAADYEKLIERSTDYKVALKPELASWYYHTWHPDMWLSITSIYEMNAPLHRIEWLSPCPVSYTGGYEHYPDWSYGLLEKCYPAGSKPLFAVGEHPFKSGVKIDIPWDGTLDIYGTISEDTYGNSFANYSANVSGNITVIKDGEVVIDHEDIKDYFGNSAYFSGTPRFNVIIQGNSSPSVSTYTRIELNFTADPTVDYQPPEVTMSTPGSDLNNTVPGGDVKVEMDIEDESNISDVTLEYSVDGGNTWNLTILTKIYEGENVSKYESDLGYMNNTFVSLRANATDSEGNSMSQTVIKGFYVSGLELIKVFDTGPGTYPSIFGTHNGTITPNQTINISKLYTYPCPGTGGHTESIKLYENNLLIANGTWNGYVSDWHNITIHNVTTGAPYIMLLKEHEYTYTLRTGSYPQIIHAKSKDAIAGAGTINCTKFIDANGKEHTGWIPAIRLWS